MTRTPSLIALGDSIVNGFTEPVAGVPALGCGQWLATRLDYSYTRYAQGGWTSHQIAEELLPRVTRDYDLAVVSIGTNDAVKKVPLDVFRANAVLILSTLAERAETVVVLSIPSSGRYSHVLERVAKELGAIVVEAQLHGRYLLRPDRIHPTALGTKVLADRMAAALGVDISTPLPMPAGRIGPGYHIRYLSGSVKSAIRSVAKRLLSR